MWTTGLLVSPLVVCLAGSLAGQEAARWRRSVYPAGVTRSGNTGPQLGVGLSYSRTADSLASHVLDAKVTAAVGYGWRGSWFGSTTFRAPGLWPGWRVVFTGLAQREARFPFVGLGNESVYDPDVVADTEPYFYRVRRTRYRAMLEGTRSIGSGYSVALAVGIAHTRFDALPGSSRFLSNHGPAVVELDRTARCSVVFDGRNNEYDPRRGLFVDLSTTVGSGGGGYTRFATAARAYVSLGTQTWAALRLSAARTVGRPPLSARFGLPLWEGDVDVLGGAASHRGLRSQRLIGRDVEFGSVEVRRSLLRRGSTVELLGAAFVDFGRVFETEPFVLTIHGLKLGPGLGVGVRYKGKSVIHVYAARGPDGVVVSSTTGWVF